MQFKKRLIIACIWLQLVNYQKSFRYITAMIQLHPVTTLNAIVIYIKYQFVYTVDHFTILSFQYIIPVHILLIRDNTLWNILHNIYTQLQIINVTRAWFAICMLINLLQLYIEFHAITNINKAIQIQSQIKFSRFSCVTSMTIAKLL